MKCVSLTKNLVPSDPSNVLKPGGDFQENSAKTLLGEFARQAEKRQEMSCAANMRKNIESRTATLGSEEKMYTMKFCDCGLFNSVLTAYNHHWSLRTSPEDWWFCVTRRVAIAIDKNSKKASVRKLFVNHDGKKELQVVVPSNTIYGIDYNWFFNEMSKKICESLKVPEYVDAVTADFSVTSPVQKIVSQITLMSSLQEFFQFKCMLSCGIPSVEMIGTEEDWLKLQTKLKVLRTLLEPIENDIRLTAQWWSLVEDVFCKLLATYRGHPDKEWWARIITETPYGSGFGGYGGWFTRFLEGRESLDFSDFSSGLVTVPLTIAHPSGVEDKAALVAGMLGFCFHTGGTTGSTPSVQPFQGWSLMLPENSPFR